MGSTGQAEKTLIGKRKSDFLTTSLTSYVSFTHKIPFLPRYTSYSVYGIIRGRDPASSNALVQ